MRHEYAQSKIQPRLHETTVRLYEIVCAEVLRACGIPPILFVRQDSAGPGSDSSLPSVLCGRIDQDDRIGICAGTTASYPNGAEISINLRPLQRFDQYSLAKALVALIDSGFTENEANDFLGII